VVSIKTPTCFCGWFADTFTCQQGAGFTIRIDDRTVEMARRVVCHYHGALELHSNAPTVKRVVVKPTTGLIDVIDFHSGAKARTTLQGDGYYLGPDECALSPEEFRDFFMVVYSWFSSVHFLYQAVPVSGE